MAGGLTERPLHRLLRCQFGLLLLFIHQMHKGLHQVVVDLAKAIIGETQPV